MLVEDLVKICRSAMMGGPPTDGWTPPAAGVRRELHRRISSGCAGASPPHARVIGMMKKRRTYVGARVFGRERVHTNAVVRIHRGPGHRAVISDFPPRIAAPLSCGLTPFARRLLVFLAA